jgi:hypothetical protein
LPEEMKNDIFLHTGCMAGASSLPDIEAYLSDAGFRDILISPEDESREFIRAWVPGSKIADYVVSATIEAIKPRHHNRVNSGCQKLRRFAIQLMAAGYAVRQASTINLYK